jgi:hypothetical protein
MRQVGVVQEVLQDNLLMQMLILAMGLMDITHPVVHIMAVLE